MLRFSRITLVFFAALTANMSGHAQPCTLALNSRIPVRLDHGTPQVKIDIEGKPAFVDFDTGASASMLTQAAVKRLGLQPDPDKSENFRGIQDEWTFTGIGGTQLFDIVLAHAVKIGQLKSRKFHFFTGDFKLGDSDGLLGREFVKDFEVDLNYPGQEIRLFRSIGQCEHAKVYLAPPLYAIPLIDNPRQRQHPPLVKIVIGGHSLVALIDTGVHKSVLYRNGAEKLGLSKSETAKDANGQTFGIGPNPVPSKSHVLPAVTIGDLTLRNMPVELIDQDGWDLDMLLGADFQKRIHLWISFSSLTLIMQYPPQPSPSAPDINP